MSTYISISHIHLPYSIIHHLELRSSLLTLGIAQTSLDLLSLNCNLEILSSLLTLGSVNKFPLLSLNRNLELRSSLLTLGSVNKFPLLSLNRNLFPIHYI